MRKIKASLLACAVLATGAFTATQASAGTFIYAVTVKTSFGTKFNDCFTFAPNGTLTVAGLGNLVYTAAPNMPKFYYSAVTSAAESSMLGHGYDFSGYKKGTAMSGSLHAVGSDDIQDSYDVHGMAVASCPVGSGGGKYVR